MKIISLNCWGSRVNPQIFDFVRFYRDEADVFCFQEVMRNTGDEEFNPVFDENEVRQTYEYFSELLPDFEYRFANVWGDDYGIATFVRRNVGIVESFDAFVHLNDTRIVFESGNEGAHSRKLLVTTLGNGISVVNFHGLWIGGFGKNDHPSRIAQSERILETLASVPGPKVLIGDFNLNPDTKSYSMLKEAGFSCMVDRFGITSTRTPLYEKEGKYADYALVTPDLPVRDFCVLPDVVSDHAPLLLEIAI